MAKSRGLKNTKKVAIDMPQPDDNKSDKHADVYFDYHNRNVTAVVGDCTISHPFGGAGRDESQWGVKVNRKLETMSTAKDRMYFEYHRNQGFLFLPLAATTFSQLEPHSIRLLWFLTDLSCKLYYLEKGMDHDDDDGGLNDGYLRFRTRVFLRHKCRIAMAVARGAARRAMLWGAGSKGKKKGGRAGATKQPAEFLGEEDMPAGCQNT